MQPTLLPGLSDILENLKILVVLGILGGIWTLMSTPFVTRRIWELQLVKFGTDASKIDFVQRARTLRIGGYGFLGFAYCQAVVIEQVRIPAGIAVGAFVWWISVKLCIKHEKKE